MTLILGSSNSKGGSAVLHRVVRARTNLPIREVITGTKTVATQRYASRRYNASFGIEGYTAMLLAEHDEVMTDIADSAPEFLRFEGVVGGKFAVTCPDRCRVLANGRVQVIECKHNWAAFSRPAARKQWLLTNAACNALGWDYIRMVPAAIGTHGLRHNIRQVQKHRFVAVSPAQEAAALSCTAGGRTTLGSLCRALEEAVGHCPGDNYPVARAVAYALMVRRVIAIDLYSDLSDNTRVERARTIPDGLPSFRSVLIT